MKNKKSFYEEVIEVLKKDKRFVSEKGEILRNAVIEAAQKMDAKLLKALRSNVTTRKRFFTDIDGIAVFDKQQFGWVVSNRAFLPDSYTRFRNKIGLAVDNLEDFTPGAVIYSVEELMRFLQNVCSGNDEYRDERTRVLNNLYEYQDGDSSYRLALHLGLLQEQDGGERKQAD